MLKALVVDDDNSVLQCFKKLIDWSSIGFEMPYTAINGQDAFAIATNENVDVVITDLKMPVMDGMELIRRLREKNKTVEIILLTAYEDFMVAREGIKLKISDYVLKPLNPETVERLNEKLKKISLRKEYLKTVNAFINGEMDEEIIHDFDNYATDCLEKVIFAITSLTQMGEQVQVFSLCMMKIIDSICRYFDKIGFKESSVKRTREGMLEIIKMNVEPEETVHLLWEKISTVLKTIGGIDSNKSEQNLVRKIKKYIDENSCKENFSIDVVAMTFHYSKDHINRIFKSSEGLTATKYIVNSRMEKARNLVLNSEMTINDIAFAVGYNSPNYFISSFKQYYKTTPAALRERSYSIDFETNKQ